MASLSNPHWNMITPGMRRLLIHIGQQQFSRRFYLAGGTAISLQIGHRRSIDLDFFSSTDGLDDKSRNEIVVGLSPFSPQIIESVGGNLLIMVDNIRTGFFSYGYPLIEESVQCENVSLASLIDLGLMKCDALISRGIRKNFYDLFYIAQSVTFEQLLLLSQKKYNQFRDFPLLVLESMTLFENTDRDIQPELVEDISWEQVRLFFVQQAELLSNRWFG